MPAGLEEPLVTADHHGFAASTSDLSSAKRKLLIGTLLCTLFMLAEIVGGLMAHSLAVMTDAAHMLSDVAGFLVSILALVLSSREATAQYSFGYHRAEVIGALASIMIVWLMTGILVYEAVQRLIKPETVDGCIMFWVSVVGIAMNIVLMRVLSHGDEGGHFGHSHSHGHGHSHGHAHAPRLPKPKAAHKPPSLTRRGDAEATRTPTDAAYKPPSPPPAHSHVHGHAAEHDEHGHSHADHEHGHEKKTSHGHGHDEHGHGHEHGHDEEHGNDCCSGEHGHGHGHDEHAHGCGHDAEHAHGHGHAHDVEHGHADDEHGEVDDDDEAEADVERNLAIRAAMAHVIGDILQSVGVCISAALIWGLHDRWLDENGISYWYRADPICTFIFSVLVMWSTMGTVQEAIHVLMAGVPYGANTGELLRRLQAIPQVLDVHDLHVWTLVGTKINIWAHLTVESGTDHTRVLYAAQKVARSVHCHHTCFQLEDVTTYDRRVEGDGCFEPGLIP